MSDDRWNSDDPEHPYVDRGPRLPPVRQTKGPLITADEIFKWLRGTFQPRMGIKDRDPKPAKPPPPPAPLGPDLTQAKALAVEFAFSPEQCERVLIVTKRDERLARAILGDSRKHDLDPCEYAIKACTRIVALTKATP